MKTLHVLWVVAVLLVLILALFAPSIAYAQASVDSPDGGGDSWATYAVKSDDAADKSDDTGTTLPTCGEWAASGPHPCPANEQADPNPAPARNQINK